MLVLFFYKETFLGLQFSPADDLFITNPWKAVKPPGYLVPSNDLRGDESLIAYPHRVDIVRDIKQFGMPLWQDHTLAGSPNTFSLHSLGAFAYPPFLAFLVLEPATANTILHLSIPLVAGLGMYLLLVRAIRHRAARLLGALAYALNGYLVVWLSAFPLSATVALLPLGIYFAWRFLEDRSWLSGALFGAVVASVIIFSYPPASIIFIVLAAIFVVCWWGQNVKLGTIPALQLGLLGALGVGLSMVALLPTIQELANYTSKAYRAPIVTGIPTRFLANWVLPNIAGSPVAHDWRAIGNYCEYVAYDGLLPLTLAMAGGGVVLYRRFRGNPLLIAALVSTLLGLALAYFGPVIRLVDAHPPFNNLNPPRWNFAVVFGVAVLAASGLDALLSRETRRAASWMVAMASAAVVAAVVVLLWVKRSEFLHGNDFIAQDYRLRLALLLAGVLVLVWIVRGPRREYGAIAVVLVVFVDLFTFGVDFNPAIPGNQMYPQTPALQYLQANSPGYRVLPAGGPFLEDPLNVYGIDVITGYDHFRDDRYIALLGANVSASEQTEWRGTGHLSLGGAVHLDDPVFNVLSVKYAYFPSQMAADPATQATHWRRVYSGTDGLIYENTEVLPKQFVQPDGQAAPVPLDHQPLRPDQDRLTVPGGGRLVWSKAFDPDWKVTINGNPVQPERYMGYLLSVRLPAQTSTVSLSYQPRAYYLGAAISAASLLLLVVLFLVGRARWSRPALSRIAPAGLPSPI